MFCRFSFNTLLLSLFTLITTCVKAQWDKQIKPGGACCYTGISVKSMHRSLYALGNNLEHSPNQYFIEKLQFSGDSITRFFQPDTLPHLGEYLNHAPNNNLIICGYTQTSTISTSMFISEIDTLGNVIWSKTHSQPNKNSALEYIESIPDGYIACGYITQANNAANDFLVVKFDFSGEIIWQKTFGFSNNDVAHVIRQTADGGYIVSGDLQELLSPNYDVYVLKLNNNGEVIWEQTIGDANNNGNQTVLEISSGEYLVVGEGNTASNPSFKVTLTRLASSGDILWTKTAGGEGTEAAFQAIEVENKSFIITGYSSSYQEAGPSSMFLAKFDSTGECLGAKHFPTTSVSIGYDLIQAPNNSIVLIGSNDNAMRIISTNDGDYTSVFEPTSIVEKTLTKNSCTLFPNPASIQLHIDCENTICHSYEISNVQGQKILHGSLLNGETIDISDVENGVHYIQLFSNSLVETYPLVIHH